MTRYLVLAMSLLSFVTAAAHADASKSIRVEILCDKDQYLADEDLWIDILIINDGIDTLTVPLAAAETDYLRFKVTDANGDTVLYHTAHIDYWEKHPTASLQPGDTLYRVYNFADGTLESDRSTALHQFPFTGSVNITAIYWRAVNSNTLSFSIVPRHGAEDEAYTLLKKARAFADFSRSNAFLVELLQQYPESVYAPTACFKLIFNYAYNDSLSEEEEIEGALKYANYIIDHYPESGRMLSALWSFAKFDKMPLRDSIVQSLLSDSPNFRTRMIARNLANNISFY